MNNRQSRNLNPARPVSIFRAVNFYAYRTSTFMHINEATLSVLVALFIRSSAVMSWSCALFFFFFVSLRRYFSSARMTRAWGWVGSSVRLWQKTRKKKTTTLQWRKIGRKTNEREREGERVTKHLKWRYYNDNLESIGERMYILQKRVTIKKK